VDNFSSSWRWHRHKKDPASWSLFLRSPINFDFLLYNYLLILNSYISYVYLFNNDDRPPVWNLTSYTFICTPETDSQNPYKWDLRFPWRCICHERHLVRHRVETIKIHRSLAE
jgi:hypothetical protein